MMHVERHYPKDEEALLQIVQSVAPCGQAIIAQAGHFLLYYDEGQQAIRPCIADPRGQNEQTMLDSFGHFPLLTWELGLRALNNANSRGKHILLLVNDWQYLPESVNRREFYASHPGLPEAFQASLSRFPDIGLLKPQTETDEIVTGCYFGEAHLRNRYKKRIAGMIRNSALPSDVMMNNDGQHTTCTMPLSGGLSTEIYCSGKSADCTAEVAELLLQISASHPDSHFINIYPLVCRDFVEKGTILASRLGGLRLLSVINVGFQSSRVHTAADLFAGCELSLFRFI